MSESSEAQIVRYRFESAAFPGEDLPVDHVWMVEALNEPYHLRVDVAHRGEDADLRAHLGQSCTLQIARDDGPSRQVHGIVRRITEGDLADGHPIAQLEVVPALFYLSLRRNSRIFQNESVPRILETVLGEGLRVYGREVSLQLEGRYPTREYCVQYQETDLDFVHRLMEEEGISYAFDHAADVEVMVLRDRNGAFSELPSGSLVEYHPHNLEVRGAEPIVSFIRAHRARTTSVVVRDWDWTRGRDMVLEAESRGRGPDERDRESYEHGRGRSLTISSYDQGVRRYQAEDGTAQSATRREQHGWDAVVATAVSRVVSAAPGLTFELGGHPTVGLDGSYLITRVEHGSRGRSDLIETGGSGDPYCNRFECIPVATPYRPIRRTPKPSIASIQTAVVTGPPGEEIHVDEHGRIRIQFHWDRDGKNDDHSSCWVRVQQPWAGPGWGFWWVPRIGMEVVVHFVDGDPDRPLVTASVYNGANPTPYTLPDDKTKSTIKSETSLGGGGFNELRFEDKAGQEEIFTHAQMDYNEVIQNDHTTLVHHDQRNTVDNDQTQTIGANQTEVVHHDQRMTIDANRTVTVHGNFDETVDGTETRKTTGNVTETFDATETRDIGLNITEDIGGNETRDVTGNQEETIGATHTVTISGSSEETITGAWSRKAAAGITTTTSGSFEITAAAGFTATAAGGIRYIAPGGMKLIGAGGVTRVDSQWNWLGGKDVKLGFMAVGATGMKIEATGISLGLFNTKIEDTGVTIGMEAANLCSFSTRLENAQVELQTGAIEVDSGQKVKTG